MNAPALQFSEDQAEAYDRVTEVLRGAGVDLDEGLLTPMAEDRTSVMAVVGKAGSGKTMLLARLYEALAEAGVEIVSGDYESRRLKDKRSLAILAPTNKAASVLRMSGVPATTIHRILYTPVYDPEYEKIAEWLAGNPILDLAHALGDDALEFEDFERMVEAAARTDDRVEVAPRVDADLMARSPVLVWRNVTRVRLIQAFRAANHAPTDALLPGEPLICDGIELPLKHRKRRIDLEARGLIKGAQVIYLGPGRKPGFSRLHVVGAEDPQISAASIIKIEFPGQEEPFIPFAARMGAAFLHGAAVTIHKAQGSQWPEVQVFAPDIWAAARAGRIEAGLPLWKRLAYVAITRAQERLIWVTRYRLARPQRTLGTEDLSAAPGPLALQQEAEET